MSEVSTLLARSRAAHANYQRANKVGDKRLEKSSIEQAKALREQAHALDPQHEDGEWIEDKVSHEAYERFYDLFLSESVSH